MCCSGREASILGSEVFLKLIIFGKSWMRFDFFYFREQRVTHILIFLMIGLSVVLTPVLSNIPMPVLFGVFLYMGVASLKGLQFFDRILIMFMPVKYQPDYMFLRQVPLKKVHIFTIIQLICLIALWVIKSFSLTSILFPLMVRNKAQKKIKHACTYLS